MVNGEVVGVWGGGFFLGFSRSFLVAFLVLDGGYFGRSIFLFIFRFEYRLSCFGLNEFFGRVKIRVFGWLDNC